MSVHSLEHSTAQLSRRAFVVVGMHRSGTSAMTRTLSLLGASLPKQLMPAVPQVNPTGFWEAQPVSDFNDELLQAQDSEWDDVFAFRERQYLSNFDRVYLGRAVDLLEQQFDGAEVIVLKDPRISVLASFWDRALREAAFDVHYVVMVRNPSDVADSLRAREGFPREKSFLLWSSYMIASDRDTRDRSRTFVSYEQLMSDWRGVRRRIEAGAGVPFPRDTTAAAIEIDRFLDPRMQHHAARPEDLYASNDVPEHVKELYRIFSEACNGGEVDASAVNAIRTRMEELEQLLGPLLADMRGSARALTKNVAELTEACAGARQRSDMLEEQVAAERILREAEAAAAAKLSEQLAVSEAELAAKQAELSAIKELCTNAQAAVAANEEKLAEQFGALNSLTEKLKRSEEQVELLKFAAEEARTGAEAAARANEQKLAERLQEVAALTELLKRSERDIEATKHQAEEVRRAAEGAARANEARLIERFQEVATLTELLKKSEREVEAVRLKAEEVRKEAEIAERENQDKLSERFREMASLTKLLKQREERAEQADDTVGWLVAVSDHLRKQPRWWRLRSARWRRQRVLRRLRELGLFDGEAYLRFYPDVAQAGIDPLDHYLSHGLREGRMRDPEVFRSARHAHFDSMS